jgi:rare lipoprotein A
LPFNHFVRQLLRVEGELMKRWLIVMSLLVAGLLMVGWAGDALAARNSPSFLQKILSMFTPHHYVGPNKTVVTQTVQTPPPVPPVRPVEATTPVHAVQAVENAEPAQSRTTSAQPARAVRPAPEPVHTTREKKADRLKLAQPVQPARQVKATESVSVPAKTSTEKTWALASVHEVPAPAPAVAPLAPIHTETAPKTAAPAEAKPTIARAQPAPEAVHATQTVKRAKPDKAQSVETAQPVPVTRPVQVAILGAPNLKAALPADNSAPTEAPRPTDEPHAPATKPEPKSACNGGQRVVSAYYWEGHHTASGQPFNPRGMTAAHRTLPFGTRLNVTNPRTGKTVNVLINDRGPFVRGVSLDLSLGAAQAIGLQGTGSVCIL